MEKILTIHPIRNIFGTINIPGSKSISNRALLLSALSSGTTILKNLLNSDDTQYMMYALKKLNIKYEYCDSQNECKIIGKSNFLYIKDKIELFLGNAGTVMRPLTAALSLKNNNKNIILNGDKRMQERPINDLVDALRQGGAKIHYLNKLNFPPILIQGGFIGGKITISGNLSSQFLSSILIIAPLSSINTKIIVKGNLVSKPYIDITLNLMKNFGIVVKNNNYITFDILANQIYKSPGEYLIEGDASSASYFFAAAAIKGGTINIKGINQNSIQGDIKFLNILEKMGAYIEYKDNSITCSKKKLFGIDIDANNIPDAAMTIAIVALFAKGKTILRNIYNWRIKETDRLHAMSIELRKIGANVYEGYDYICIDPPKKFNYAIIDTYNDHRMAMCFSLIALSNRPISILNPQCISKTFPNYFKYFNSIIEPKISNFKF